MTRRLTAVLLLLVCTGCSRKKTLAPDDLKSQLTRAISFASEEELFVDYIRAGRATSNCAEQHAAYLDAEIQVQPTNWPKPFPNRKRKVAECGLHDPCCWSAASILSPPEADRRSLWFVLAVSGTDKISPG